MGDYAAPDLSSEREALGGEIGEVEGGVDADGGESRAAVHAFGELILA